MIVTSQVTVMLEVQVYTDHIDTQQSHETRAIRAVQSKLDSVELLGQIIKVQIVDVKA